MHKNGKGYESIATDLGVHESTVCRNFWTVVILLSIFTPCKDHSKNTMDNPERNDKEPKDNSKRFPENTTNFESLCSCIHYQKILNKMLMQGQFVGNHWCQKIYSYKYILRLVSYLPKTTWTFHNTSGKII